MELEGARQRLQGEDLKVLGLRFTEDWFCPSTRFVRLRREFGERFEGIEIDSAWGNPDDIPCSAHSVLTIDFQDKDGHPTRQALERTLSFLRERLR